MDKSNLMKQIPTNIQEYWAITKMVDALEMIKRQSGYWAYHKCKSIIKVKYIHRTTKMKVDKIAIRLAVTYAAESKWTKKDKL